MSKKFVLIEYFLYRNRQEILDIQIYFFAVCNYKILNLTMLVEIQAYVCLLLVPVGMARVADPAGFYPNPTFEKKMR